MKKALFLVVLILVLLFVGSNSFVTVDPTVFVYVTQFGDHVVTYDGGDNENDAGFHIRLPWPIQSVQKVDRRLQVFDIPGIELLTRDQKKQNTIDQTLTVDAYVCWRIVDKEGVDLFIRKVGSPQQAKILLEKQIQSQLIAAVGKRSMSNLLQQLKEVGDALRADQQRRIRDEYGIQIVDIRLRRLNYPAKVHPAIFEKITSEREIQASTYRQEGNTAAAEILEAAKRDKRITIARAKKEADTLKSAAVAEGDRIRNRAHARERDFYRFLKKLKDYEQILGDSKTVLYLSAQREMFQLLFDSRGERKPAVPAKSMKSTKSGG
jgi:membrane protease subunit HflC